MSFFKVIYLYHDCFIVKTTKAVLVFDFWKDPYQLNGLPNPLKNVDRDLPIYVFVSHSHKDHFNPQIFDWAVSFKNIKFIISKDVRKRIHHILSESSLFKGNKIDQSMMEVLSEEDSYEDEILSVVAFSSTDLGNSYAITLDEKTIFHAGDLNAWIWKDESSEEEIMRELDKFNFILDKISSIFSHFDFCFFPVDSRIGTDYFTGAKIFLNKFKVDNFFPMHFELGEDNDSIARLHRDAADFGKYATPKCKRYIVSAPYSVYAIQD